MANYCVESDKKIVRISILMLLVHNRAISADYFGLFGITSDLYS